jgi:hypothetical protein
LNESKSSKNTTSSTGSTTGGVGVGLSSEPPHPVNAATANRDKQMFDIEKKHGIDWLVYLLPHRPYMGFAKLPPFVIIKV